MKYISNEYFNKEMRKIERDNISYRRKKELRKSKEYLPRIKMPSTSKVVLWAVILLCVQMIIFVERIVLLTGDTSALIAFIGVMPTLISVVVSYYNKSAKENTVGGIVYETAMREHIEYAPPSDSAEG